MALQSRGEHVPPFVAALGRFATDASLAFCVDATGGSLTDLLSGKGPTARSAIWGTSMYAGGPATDATRTGLVYAAPPLQGATWLASTYVCVVKPTGTNTGTSRFIMAQGVSGDPAHSLFYNVTNQNFGILENSASNAAASSAPVGRTYVVVAIKNGSTHRIFQDGVQVLSDTLGQATARATGVLGLMRQGAATTNSASGTLPFAAVFARALSDTEAIELSRDLMAAYSTVNQRRRLRPRYSAAASGPTAALAGTVRAAAVVLGATIGSVLTLTPAPVRATARAGPGSIAQTQAVAGTVRSAPRLVGSLPIITALSGVSRVTPRLTGATITQAQALRGSVRATARASGSLGQSQALAGSVRSSARLSGAIAQLQALTGTARSGGRLLGGSVSQAQSVRGTVRTAARLPGATLTIPAPGTTAIAGTSRTGARLRGLTITQAVSLGSGVARAVARSTGLITQATPLAGFARAVARATGSLAQAQALLGRVRSAARLSGAIASGATAAETASLDGTLSLHARLTGHGIVAPALDGHVRISHLAASYAMTEAAITGVVSARPRLTGSVTIYPT